MTALQVQVKRPAVQRCERTQRVAATADGGVPAQLRLAQSLNNGVSVQRLTAVQHMLDHRATVQRQEFDEEDLAAQMKIPAQRQPIGDEEELSAQMKPVSQREDTYDEELMAQMKPAMQRQDLDEEEDLAAQMKPAVQRADGAAAAGGGSGGIAGGLPAPLRSGMESLSGMDMGGVRVHRNSDKPQGIGALAYAQGDDIYLGAGQDRHLPHEAWHVVQQRQGRVAATMQFNGTAINDSPALEREADTMGGRAERAGQDAPAAVQAATEGTSAASVAQGKIAVLDGGGVAAAAAEPAQRVVTYDESTKTFGSDSKRAGWRSYLKESTATEVGVSKSTSFATLGYDRAHRIPYAALQGLLVDYCNDDASGSDLVALTDSLYDTSGSNSEYDNMVSQRDDLIKSHGGKPSSERLFANALLATLNSATFNVSPGDFSTNRSIQDNVDYGYQMSPGGTSVELTPRSKQLHDVWSTYDREPPVPTSPGGTTVKSSQVSSKGGTFKFDDVDW